MTTRNIEDLRKEVAAHIEADALVRGQYWKSGKGCFIGCLTHSDDPSPAVERFGLTEPLLRIAEDIFENLPDDEGRAFFAALPDAVERDGKDLSRVHWAFLAAELRALPSVPQEVRAVIDPVIAGMDLLARGGEWPMADARSAANAARAARAARAVRAVRSAASAAAYAANAAYAAAQKSPALAVLIDEDAAYDAAAAVAHAADAADTDPDGLLGGAIDAAYAAARLRQRSALLRLIKDAE